MEWQGKWEQYSAKNADSTVLSIFVINFLYIRVSQSMLHGPVTYRY